MSQLQYTRINDMGNTIHQTNVFYKSDNEEVYELERLGTDAEKLGFMRRSERRKVLKEAGLNPDEYDF